MLELAHQFSSSDRVILILKDFKSKELYIEGEARDQKITSGLKIKIVDATHFLHKNINLASRTMNLLIINEVENEISAADYPSTDLPKSLAIVPIIHKGELAGLLYLEHHLLNDVYSMSRTLEH